MEFSSSFIYASPEYTTFEKFVPAPYFRKELSFSALPKSCELNVSGLGFYRLWVNGKEITKGLLAPYISNPDDIVYFDNYDIMPYITEGENVLGFQLGNGMQNSPGGQVWDFEKARFRGAPRLAFAVSGEDDDGDDYIIEADETVKTAPSPVYFDDLRCGTRYDARKELPGWNTVVYDDSGWSNAVFSEKPRGEFRVCEAEPILPTGEEHKAAVIRKAVLAPYVPAGQVRDVVPFELPGDREGWLYEFGINKTGYCALKIKGRKGQRIELQYGEYITSDGVPSYSNIAFYPDGYSQRDVYICKGEGVEEFVPPFTYHGFSYCFVIGIDDEQATEELLTYIVCNSSLPVRGSFTCSDDTANALQDMALVSDLSNFFYFPTDCPHREKNGWTGDASVSAEHMLLNFAPEKSYTEWLRNIRKAQNCDGALPGIVPTGGWGFEWGNGPAWDAVLTYLPYYTYIYTGDTDILKENAHAIMNYLDYISTHRTARGTVELGLGDWVPVENKVKVPLEFTDSVTVMSIASKASFIFGVLGMQAQKAFADTLYGEVRAAIRKHFINTCTMTVNSFCQTAQSMAIYFNVFDESEKPEAGRRLVELIHSNNDFIDVGMLGIRVLFHVLADLDEGELAYKMITRPEWPSYGHFVKLGLKSLPEDFFKDWHINSLNHHFLGDISSWFITRLTGLRYNPHGDNGKQLVINPIFVDGLDFAESTFVSPYGKIKVRWERRGDEIAVISSFPNALDTELLLPCGWVIKGKGITRDSIMRNGEIIITHS